MKAPITHTLGQDQVLLLWGKLWRTGEENSAFNIIVVLTVYKQGRSRALRGKVLCLALFSWTFLSGLICEVFSCSGEHELCRSKPVCPLWAQGWRSVQCVLGALAVSSKDRDQQLAEWGFLVSYLQRSCGKLEKKSHNRDWLHWDLIQITCP